MHISTVSKRYCQLIIFLNFITLQGRLFTRVSDCTELESAFNLMLFYCGPLSSPLLPSRSSVEHLLWQRGQIIVFLCDPVKILGSEQNTRGEQQFKLLSLHIEKWVVKPTTLRKDFPFAINQQLDQERFPHWKLIKIKTQWTELQHMNPHYLILVT